MACSRFYGAYGGRCHRPGASQSDAGLDELDDISARNGHKLAYLSDADFAELAAAGMTGFIREAPLRFASLNHSDRGAPHGSHRLYQLEAGAVKFLESHGLHYGRESHAPGAAELRAPNGVRVYDAPVVNISSPVPAFVASGVYTLRPLVGMKPVTYAGSGTWTALDDTELTGEALSSYSDLATAKKNALRIAKLIAPAGLGIQVQGTSTYVVKSSATGSSSPGSSAFAYVPSSSGLPYPPMALCAGFNDHAMFRGAGPTAGVDGTGLDANDYLCGPSSSSSTLMDTDFASQYSDYFLVDGDFNAGLLVDPLPGDDPVPVKMGAPPNASALVLQNGSSNLVLRDNTGVSLCVGSDGKTICATRGTGDPFSWTEEGYLALYTPGFQAGSRDVGTALPLYMAKGTGASPVVLTSKTSEAVRWTRQGAPSTVRAVSVAPPLSWPQGAADVREYPLYGSTYSRFGASHWHFQAVWPTGASFPHFLISNCWTGQFLRERPGGDACTAEEGKCTSLPSFTAPAHGGPDGCAAVPITAELALRPPGDVRKWASFTDKTALWVPQRMKPPMPQWPPSAVTADPMGYARAKQAVALVNASSGNPLSLWSTDLDNAFAIVYAPTGTQAPWSISCATQFALEPVAPMQRATGALSLEGVPLRRWEKAMLSRSAALGVHSPYGGLFYALNLKGEQGAAARLNPKGEQGAAATAIATAASDASASRAAVAAYGDFSRQPLTAVVGDGVAEIVNPILSSRFLVPHVNSNSTRNRRAFSLGVFLRSLGAVFFASFASDAQRVAAIDWFPILYGFVYGSVPYTAFAGHRKGVEVGEYAKFDSELPAPVGDEVVALPDGTRFANSCISNIKRSKRPKAAQPTWSPIEGHWKYTGTDVSVSGPQFFRSAAADAGGTPSLYYAACVDDYLLKQTLVDLESEVTVSHKGAWYKTLYSDALWNPSNTASTAGLPASSNAYWGEMDGPWTWWVAQSPVSCPSGCVPYVIAVTGSGGDTSGGQDSFNAPHALYAFKRTRGAAITSGYTYPNGPAGGVGTFGFATGAHPLGFPFFYLAVATTDGTGSPSTVVPGLPDTPGYTWLFATLTTGTVLRDGGSETADDPSGTMGGFYPFQRSTTGQYGYPTQTWSPSPTVAQLSAEPLLLYPWSDTWSQAFYFEYGDIPANRFVGTPARQSRLFRCAHLLPQTVTSSSDLPVPKSLTLADTEMSAVAADGAYGFSQTYNEVVGSVEAAWRPGTSPASFTMTWGADTNIASVSMTSGTGSSGPCTVTVEPFTANGTALPLQTATLTPSASAPVTAQVYFVEGGSPGVRSVKVTVEKNEGLFGLAGMGLLLGGSEDAGSPGGPPYPIEIVGVQVSAGPAGTRVVASSVLPALVLSPEPLYSPPELHSIQNPALTTPPPPSPVRKGWISGLCSATHFELRRRLPEGKTTSYECGSDDPEAEEMLHPQNYPGYESNFDIDWDAQGAAAAAPELGPTTQPPVTEVTQTHLQNSATSWSAMGALNGGVYQSEGPGSLDEAPPGSPPPSLVDQATVAATNVLLLGMGTFLPSLFALLITEPQTPILNPTTPPQLGFISPEGGNMLTLLQGTVAGTVPADAVLPAGTVVTQQLTATQTVTATLASAQTVTGEAQELAVVDVQNGPFVEGGFGEGAGLLIGDLVFSSPLTISTVLPGDNANPRPWPPGTAPGTDPRPPANSGNTSAWAGGSQWAALQTMTIAFRMLYETFNHAAEMVETIDAWNSNPATQNAQEATGISLTLQANPFEAAWDDGATPQSGFLPSPDTAPVTPHRTVVAEATAVESIPELLEWLRRNRDMWERASLALITMMMVSVQVEFDTAPGHPGGQVGDAAVNVAINRVATAVVDNQPLPLPGMPTGLQGPEWRALLETLYLGGPEGYMGDLSEEEAQGLYWGSPALDDTLPRGEQVWSRWFLHYEFEPPPSDNAPLLRRADAPRIPPSRRLQRLADFPDEIPVGGVSTLTEAPPALDGGNLVHPNGTPLGFWEFIFDLHRIRSSDGDTALQGTIQLQRVTALVAGMVIPVGAIVSQDLGEAPDGTPIIATGRVASSFTTTGLEQTIYVRNVRVSGGGTGFVTSVVFSVSDGMHQIYADFGPPAVVATTPPSETAGGLSYFPVDPVEALARGIAQMIQISLWIRAAQQRFVITQRALENMRTQIDPTRPPAFSIARRQQVADALGASLVVQAALADLTQPRTPLQGLDPMVVSATTDGAPRPISEIAPEFLSLVFEDAEGWISRYTTAVFLMNGDAPQPPAVPAVPLALPTPLTLTGATSQSMIVLFLVCLVLGMDPKFAVRPSAPSSSRRLLPAGSGYLAAYPSGNVVGHLTPAPSSISASVSSMLTLVPAATSEDVGGLSVPMSFAGGKITYTAADGVVSALCSYSMWTPENGSASGSGFHAVLGDSGGALVFTVTPVSTGESEVTLTSTVNFMALLDVYLAPGTTAGSPLRLVTVSGGGASPHDAACTAGALWTPPTEWGPLS